MKTACELRVHLSVLCLRRNQALHFHNFAVSIYLAWMFLSLLLKPELVNLDLAAKDKTLISFYCAT